MYIYIHYMYIYYMTLFKGNAQFVQKVNLEPLMDFKQTYYSYYGNWKCCRSCYF